MVVSLHNGFIRGDDGALVGFEGAFLAFARAFGGGFEGFGHFSVMRGFGCFGEGGGLYLLPVYLRLGGFAAAHDGECDEDGGEGCACGVLFEGHLVCPFSDGLLWPCLGWRFLRPARAAPAKEWGEIQAARCRGLGRVDLSRAAPTGRLTARQSWDYSVGCYSDPILPCASFRRLRATSINNSYSRLVFSPCTFAGLAKNSSTLPIKQPRVAISPFLPQ